MKISSESHVLYFELFLFFFIDVSLAERKSSFDFVESSVFLARGEKSLGKNFGGTIKLLFLTKTLEKSLIKLYSFVEIFVWHKGVLFIMVMDSL